jgi:hypothetical protein
VDVGFAELHLAPSTVQCHWTAPSLGICWQDTRFVSTRSGTKPGNDSVHFMAFISAFSNERRTYRQNQYFHTHFHILIVPTNMDFLNYYSDDHPEGSKHL